jgi:UDP-glucose 4-epimerase
MRVLVTGGLGFLGHAVTLDLLAAGHQVTVLTRGRADAKPAAGADLAEGDLRDRDRIREIIVAGRFDAVCHLAAVTRARDSFADPLTYYDVNVGGTLNVLMALDAVRGSMAPPRMVFTSTNIVYGSQHNGALSEELTPHPESPYAASKVAAEQLVAAYAATGAIGAVILRPFNIAGSVDGVTDTDTTRIIPNAFRAASGELPHVTLNGDGSAVRDFVHVLDVAAAVSLSLAADGPGKSAVYNIGSGTGSSMTQVVKTAESVTGRPIPINRLPPKPEPQTLIASIHLAAQELRWRPQRSRLNQIVADVWNAWPK